VRGWVVLATGWASWLLATMTAAVPAGGELPGPLAAAEVDSAAWSLDLLPWNDVEAVRDWLSVLEAEELQLDPEELQRLGLDLQPPATKPLEPSPAATSGAAAARWHGRLSARAGWNDGQAGTRQVRIQLGNADWQAAGRFRQASEGPAGGGGFLCWGDGGTGAALGGMGWQHGLGLYSAGPGLWRSLSAGSALAGGGERLAPYAGHAESRAVWGASGRTTIRGLTVCALAGRLQMADPAGTNPNVGLGSTALTWQRGRASLLAGRQGPFLGGSFLTEVQSQRANVRLEVAGWRRRGQKRPDLAWAVDGLWRGRRGSLEGQLAAADAGPPPPLAGRPAVLPAWRGWGWALRARGRLSSATQGQALLASGCGREPPGESPVQQRESTLELGLRARLTDRWRCEIRGRLQREEGWGWVDRAPWLPPALYRSLCRQRCVLRVEHLAEASRLVLSLRLQSQSDPSDADAPVPVRTRRLISLQVERRWREHWRFRVAGSWAWGDALDLLSVIAPVQGLVLPRHWGSWAEETLLGAEYGRGPCRWQAAAAWRTPATCDGGGHPHLEIWARLEAAW
jgi:hypothetical protein